MPRGTTTWVVLTVWCLLVSFFAVPLHGRADQSEPPPQVDHALPVGESDTLLMFVGEKLDVLNIASRREENAAQAPAIAQVITREELMERGVDTLSEALACLPGFYMAQREGGTQAYLRGISDGVLLLYDAVPIGSYVSKSFHQLDQEISLASVKRIEIIRGPGSVLWGPDAYAGVINIVPMTGKDMHGGNVGLLYGTPGAQKGGYGNVGGSSSMLDASLSMSVRKGELDDRTGNIDRFWGDGTTAVPPDDRYGEVAMGDSTFAEASGRLGYKDRIFLSGRVSNSEHPYSMTDSTGEYTWRESKNVFSGFVKLESKLDLDYHSGLRWMGSYSWFNPEYRIIDLTLDQEEETIYAELIYDRTFRAGRSLFTAGGSYRDNQVRGAPAWDGYLPDYLGSDNVNLLPLLTQVDYDAQLISVFGQYVHKIANLDLMAGLRYDSHDTYTDAVSYNIGIVWSPSQDWIFKALHGTAYRTPYATQLREENHPKPEKIVNYSAQASWRPSERFSAAIALFNNDLEHHVVEDPYAGLSNPNHQTIYGVETDLSWKLFDSFTLRANFTMLDHRGPQEIYRYNDYSYIDEETGELVDHYTDLFYPFDVGADQLFNLQAVWRPINRLTSIAVIRYIGDRDLIHPREETVTHCDSVWLLDLSVTFKQLVLPKTDLTLSINNVFDTRYRTPGTYSIIDGKPITVMVTLSIPW